jgi:hypothetical protein
VLPAKMKKVTKCLPEPNALAYYTKACPMLFCNKKSFVNIGALIGIFQYYKKHGVYLSYFVSPSITWVLLVKGRAI